MTDYVKEGEVWEDAEGYHWKVIENTDPVKCQCVFVPKKSGLVGRYKLGANVLWEYEGKNSDVFHKLIVNSMGEAVEQKELEKITIKGKGEGKESHDETYESDVYQTEAQAEGGEGKPKPIEPDDPNSVEYLFYSIMNLGDEFESRKVSYNDFTKARLTKESLNKIMDRAFKLVDGINTGTSVKKSKMLSRADLADINKGIKASKLKQTESMEPVAGQIWESLYKANQSHGDRIKIIGIVNDDIFALRVLTSEGKTPTYSMCMKQSKSRLTGYYLLTDQTSDVTLKEMGQFPALKEIQEKLLAESLSQVKEDDPLIRRLNGSYSETWADIKNLVKLRFKLFEDI